MGAKQENVKWVDGLRGLGSLLVVLTHISRSFDARLFHPKDNKDTEARLVQLPIIRVFLQGRIGVAIFSLVTGYVCALKPIRLSKTGNPEGALVAIAKSAFRRVPRLILPATIATVLIGIICLTGAFEVARHTDSFWLSYTAPVYTASLTDSFKATCYNIITTWTKNTNQYDCNQWTLMPLLRGSMQVYVTVSALIFVEPWYRMMISLALWTYAYVGNDGAFGMQFYFGIFLADFQNYTKANAWAAARPWTRNILPPILVTIGLWLCSYPEEYAEWAPWSKQLQTLANYAIPSGFEFPRYFTGIGLEFIVMGINFSPQCKDWLSNRVFLWLGKYSFAVYLVHGTIMRTIFTWMLYGINIPDKVKNDKDEMVNGTLHTPSNLIIGVALPIFFAITYAVAYLWTNHVDPLCARMSLKLEQYVWAEGEKTVIRPQPQ